MLKEIYIIDDDESSILVFNKLFENDSSFVDSLLITPSIYLLTESINTIAGISPPVKT